MRGTRMQSGRDSQKTRLTEVRSRTLMSHGEAINEEERGSGTAVCSGPGDEQGWEAGGPPPEPDVWGCNQLPCTS
jgi:hypothetical protein